jgi:NADH pyrophosphatase NudC (nudix superfamily)
VGVFGGPEFVGHYRNGHRTSYVMLVFEAELDGGSPRADTTEILEMRFVSEREADALPKATWVPEVLRAVFSTKPACAFRPQTWKPPT